MDEKYCRRCELARKRIKDFSDTYGECRDSEQTPCVCEPVGMANCVPPKTTTVRKTGICALAMSHAQTKQQRGASSWLESGDLLIWLYMANAATTSKKRSVCESVGKANCVPTESTAVRKTVRCRSLFQQRSVRHIPIFCSLSTILSFSQTCEAPPAYPPEHPDHNHE